MTDKDHTYLLIRLREELGLDVESTQPVILADIRRRMIELYEAKQEAEKGRAALHENCELRQEIERLRILHAEECANRRIAEEEIRRLYKEMDNMSARALAEATDLRVQLGKALMCPHQFATSVTYQIQCEPDAVIDMLNRHITDLNKQITKLELEVRLLKMRLEQPPTGTGE